MDFFNNISNNFFNYHGNQNQINKPAQNNNLAMYAIPFPSGSPLPSGIYKYAIPDIAPHPAPNPYVMYAIPTPEDGILPNPVIKYAVPAPSETPASEGDNPQPVNPWGGNIFQNFISKIVEFFSNLFQ